MQHARPILLVFAMCAALFATYVFANHLTTLTRPGDTSNSEHRQKTLKLTPVLVGKDCVFYDVDFSAGGIAWAVGYDGHDPQQMYRSNDGGRTWEVRKVETDGSVLAAITFIDAQHGWAVGAGVILHTDDGGGTWKLLKRLPKSDLTEVTFVNPQVGYVAGGTEWGCEIFRTADGGRSWQKVYEAPKSGYVFELATLGERIVVAAINDDHLIRTEDGGATWHELVSLNGAASVAFNSQGIGWVVGRKGSFYRSTDQGTTWHRPTNLPQSLQNRNWTSVNFTGRKMGLAVGDDGVIAVTYDGETWSESNTNIGENFRAVRLNNETGLIIGSQKVYSVSLNQQLLVASR